MVRATNTGATEVWYDGVDADCAGDSDYDADGDTFDSDAYGGTDCNDAVDTTYTGGLSVRVTSVKPQKEIGGTLLQVFDTMDDDGNGVLSFKEINHYLRAGRHEIVLDEKLQAGAVTVQAPQSPVPQPSFVPVSPSSSRNTSNID